MSTTRCRMALRRLASTMTARSIRESDRSAPSKLARACGGRAVVGGGRWRRMGLELSCGKGLQVQQGLVGAHALSPGLEVCSAEPPGAPWRASKAAAQQPVLTTTLLMKYAPCSLEFLKLQSLRSHKRRAYVERTCSWKWRQRHLG